MERYLQALRAKTRGLGRLGKTGIAGGHDVIARNGGEMMRRPRRCSMGGC